MPTYIENIALDIVTTPDFEGGNIHAHRAVITASSTDDPDANIFVFQVETINADTGEKKAFLRNVASVNDYEELPVGPPTADEYTVFRHNVLEYFDKSYTGMMYTLDLIQADVAAFTAAMKQAKQWNDANSWTVNL